MHSHVHVAPSSAPRNVTASVVNSTTIRFTMVSPPVNELNGDLVGYTLQCTPATRDLNQPINLPSQAELTVIIAGFRPGTPYNCLIGANNTNGKGPDASVFALTPEEG